MAKRLLAGISVLALCQALGAQGADRFDAASIRTSSIQDLSEVIPGVFADNRRWSARGATLPMLLRSAYGLPANRITGSLPSWAYTDRFDVTTTAEAGRDLAALRTMAQQLLAERFRLRTHWAVREAEVFALERVRGDGALGAGLRSAARSCDRTNGSDGLSPTDPCAEKIDRTEDGSFRYRLRDRALVDVLTMTSARLQIGEPIVDRTDLGGRFDLDFHFMPLELLQRQRDQPSNAVPLGVAVVEQLGLRFVRRTEFVEVLVIDGVSRLSDN